MKKLGMMFLLSASTVFAQDGTGADVTNSWFKVGDGSAKPILESDFGRDAFMWLGPHSVGADTMTRQPDGNYVVSTGRFKVTLTPDGEVLQKESFGVANRFGDVTVEKVDLAKTEKPNYGPYDDPFKIISAINQHREQFDFTLTGTPIPVGGLSSEVEKVVSACIEEGKDRQDEARLMDFAVASREFAGGNDFFMDEYLVKKKGVKPEDLPQARATFTAEAKRRTKEREAKYELEWQRKIRSNGPQYRKKGYAEVMGEAGGPYIADGVFGAATAGAGSLLASRITNLGTSIAAGSTASGAIMGAAGTPVGDLGAKMGAGYGRYIDETGNNPLLPSVESGHSPRPDKSVLDSIEEAFDKLVE